jgi:hypothetical protein
MYSLRYITSAQLDLQSKKAAWDKQNPSKRLDAPDEGFTGTAAAVLSTCWSHIGQILGRQTGDYHHLDPAILRLIRLHDMTHYGQSSVPFFLGSP